MYKFISKSENDTIEFANNLANQLKNGDIIVLSGDLGSGKTKFTQGILKHFDLENEISSPTFTIVNEYHKDKTNIYHFDVYRLTDSDEFYAIGGEEYFEKGICLIEWGEILQNILPKEYIHITFKKDNNYENKRILELTAHGERYEKILENFKEELN